MIFFLFLVTEIDPNSHTYHVRMYNIICVTENPLSVQILCLCFGSVRDLSFAISFLSLSLPLSVLFVPMPLIVAVSFHGIEQAQTADDCITEIE